MMVSCEVFCARSVLATSPMVSAARWRVREIARAGAVARFLNRHRRKRRESFDQCLHDGCARRRDQFDLNAGGINRSALQQFDRRRSRAREGLHARTSPFRRRRSAASRQSHPLPGLGSDRGANDIDHRVHRADFVEVDFLDVVVVNLGFRRAQRLKDGDRGALRALADCATCR